MAFKVTTSHLPLRFLLGDLDLELSDEMLELERDLERSNCRDFLTNRPEGRVIQLN